MSEDRTSVGLEMQSGLKLLAFAQSCGENGWEITLQLLDERLGIRWRRVRYLVADRCQWLGHEVEGLDPFHAEQIMYGAGYHVATEDLFAVELRVQVHFTEDLHWIPLSVPWTECGLIQRGRSKREPCIPADDRQVTPCVELEG